MTLRRGGDFRLSIRTVGVDGPSSVRVRALAGMPSPPDIASRASIASTFIEHYTISKRRSFAVERKKKGNYFTLLELIRLDAGNRRRSDSPIGEEAIYISNIYYYLLTSFSLDGR